LCFVILYSVFDSHIMSSKKILFNTEAREALKRGIDKVSNAVRVTIGPRGRNAVLEKSYGAPTITNDGVSIAKDIELADKFENMGAEIVKEVASKTNDTAGDGTTTAIILAQALVTEGLRHTTLGVNAMSLRRGMELAGQDVVEGLRSISKPIKGKEEVRQVATISSESEELGTIIAETIEKVGKDGVVTVEESQTLGIESEIVEGLEFDKGYISAYLVTNPERMEAEYRDVHVLVTDKKISTVKEILPFLESLAASGSKDLVIIAEDVDGEALATFVVNKLRGGFNVLAVKAPGFGDRKKEMLSDIAVTVGAKVISEETGTKLENATISMLGRARRVVSTKDSTVIVGGKGKKSDIDARVAQLRTQLESSDSKYDREKLQERIGKLTGGVAVIRVGAATETEMKYLKHKIEDAVNATKAAVEEGIVPGGGSALVKVAKKLEGKRTGTDAESVGYGIVVHALHAPLQYIAINAGKDDGLVIVDRVKNSGKNSGYNAADDKIVEDMLEEGIVDPVKVTRAALQNAISAASLLITTEVAIAEEPKQEQSPAINNSGMDY
jgi:chaperonin GroEL